MSYGKRGWNIGCLVLGKNIVYQKYGQSYSSTQTNAINYGIQTEPITHIQTKPIPRIIDIFSIEHYFIILKIFNLHPQHFDPANKDLKNPNQLTPNPVPPHNLAIMQTRQNRLLPIPKQPKQPLLTTLIHHLHLHPCTHIEQYPNKHKFIKFEIKLNNKN